MTIYDYIKKYGNYTFEEKEINEVDKVIFSGLGYADLENILTKKSKKTIEEISIEHRKLHKGLIDKNIISVREGHKILHAMEKTKRYKDCLIYNYEYIGNDDIQFGAFSIEYQKNKIYVVFEGTNQLFSGWIEDFMLSCEFPTLSQKEAIHYLNKHLTFTNKELMIGGHSKGGNLALVAGMYSNFLVRRKIKHILNADGPGLLDKQFSSNRYKNISKKYIHIMPESSYIGLFLNRSNDKVIKVTSKTPYSHSVNYWVVEDDQFIETELCPMSQKLDEKFKNWLIKYNNQDKYNFIKNLDNILEEAGVTSILELVSNSTKIFKLIQKSQNMSEETKKMIKELINIILDCFKETKQEEIKEFVNNIFKSKEEKQGE